MAAPGARLFDVWVYGSEDLQAGPLLPDEAQACQSAPVSTRFLQSDPRCCQGVTGFCPCRGYSLGAKTDKTKAITMLL